MRLVTEIPHQEFKITVFSWNQKYLIKFEQPGFEQTYKIPEMNLDDGDTSIKALVANEQFIKTVSERFTEMRKDFFAAVEVL
jgi:hypothetical protein